MSAASYNGTDTATVAAISTAMGGGIGIVRISGSGSVNIIRKVFSNAGKLESHRVYYGHITDRIANTKIDEVLVTVFRSPRSYTKEDVAEISCHGGAKSLQRILELVLRSGAVLAEPGEFTKRAFLNGRIDLMRAEAVIDIINAKTDMSHKAAVVQLGGVLSSDLKRSMDVLLGIIARIEAAIDYPEHEFVFESGTVGQIEAVRAELERLYETAESGRIIRDGIDVLIVGRPNVGKSSLLNALLDFDRAIVTEVPGTTRDTLTEFISIGGLPVKLTDTAGLRKTADAVEKLGVDRTAAGIETADLILFVLDGSEELTAEDMDIWERVKDKNVIIIENKADVGARIARPVISLAAIENKTGIIAVSAKSKTNLGEITGRIKDMFAQNLPDMENNAIITNTRHKNAVRTAIDALESALKTVSDGLPEDFVSIDLQRAYDALGEITGDSVGADLIDRIFTGFCLGK